MGAPRKPVAPRMIEIDITCKSYGDQPVLGNVFLEIPAGDCVAVLGPSGIGKTTLAANLAVYIRAMREDLPILVIGLDDQNTLDRYFSLDSQPRGTVLSGIRAGSFAEIVCEGQYGIHFVPSCDDIGAAKQAVSHISDLQAILSETGWRGLVIAVSDAVGTFFKHMKRFSDVRGARE